MMIRWRPLIALLLVIAAAVFVAGKRDRNADVLRRPVVSSRASLFVLPVDGNTARPFSRALRTFTFLSSPHFSPDGDVLAFTAQRCPQCAHLLQTVSADGLRVLSRHALRATWFRHGRRLIFVHIGREGTTLAEIGADGRDLRTIPEEDGGGAATFDTPTVSPDGKRVAFASEIDPVESREILVRNIATRRTKQITPLPLVSTEPDFSPNGRLIAFACQLRAMATGICVAAPDGSRRRVLTTGPDDRTPTFAPDGRTIVFSSNRADVAAGIRSIYEVTVDGHRLRRLTRGADDAEPAFSPHGRIIVFVRRELRDVEVPEGASNR